MIRSSASWGATVTEVCVSVCAYDEGHIRLFKCVEDPQPQAREHAHGLKRVDIPP